MPVEVLHKIAERLDLASQVELRHTSKHLHKALQDKVQFVKSFESACSVPLDATRCTAEAFALCGIELLSHLPATFDPATSQVTVVYMDEKRKTEEACIWSRHPRFQFQFSQGSMEKFEERNREVFICRKPEVHQMLCNAPFKMKNCDVQRVAGRLVLTSRPAASMEDLH